MDFDPGLNFPRGADDCQDPWSRSWRKGEMPDFPEFGLAKEFPFSSDSCHGGYTTTSFGFLKVASLAQRAA
jgi:hypothetical protein